MRLGARHSLALLMTIVFVTACGSSTTPTEQQAAAEATDDSLSDLGGVKALPEGAHVNKKGQVVNKQGDVIGTAEEFGLDPDTGSPTTAAPPGSGGGVPKGIEGGGDVAAGTPGITDSTIYVAVFYQDSGSANQAAFGTPIDVDARKAWNAMSDYVNKHGEVLGRKVEPIYYKLDAASSQTIDQQVQAACSHWTEDNEVFAFLAADNNGLLHECAERAGAVQVIPGGNSLPEDFKTYPHYIETSGMNFIRAGQTTVTGLDTNDYFGSEPKLGVVTWDDDKYKDALKRGYLPTLDKLGIELATEPAYISPPQTFSDLAATSADINSAVLRFQTQGITHVMIIDGPTGLCAQGCQTILFTQRADKQEYYPRYGFNNGNVAKAGYDLGVIPEDQLKGSIIVEWSDSDKFYDEGYKLNKAREKCYAIMRDYGVPMENPNQQYSARSACEILWFMQTIIDIEIAGAVPLSNDTFIQAVNGVGWNYASTNAYAAHLSATQHDGNSAARNMKFVSGCSCFKWTSDPYRV